jgi:transitional endoplasmic reticulum ATPase
MSATKTAPSNSGKKLSAKKKSQLKKISFGDIGGLESQMKQLQELTGLLKDGALRDLVKNLGIGAKLPRGVLLYGPPGTGKTLLAKAAIFESGVHYSAISTLEALSTSTLRDGGGEVEPHLFRVFSEAKDKAPHIVFIDDLETICPKYDTGHMTFQESKAVGTLVNLIDSLSETEGNFLK